MKILLLENYLPDRQQSMLRFGDTLVRSLRRRGHAVETIRPSAHWLRLAERLCRGSKWVGYIDKYLVFPRQLRSRIVAMSANDGPEVVHVVDHSNAVYIPRRPPQPWIATCHDLLAVRGALGEDTDCSASMFGRRLQVAIRAGLGRATGIAADSTSTLRDVERLVRAPAVQIRRLILLGLNHPYCLLDAATTEARLRGMPGIPWDRPFVVHVGSNLTRKNKLGVFRVFARMSAAWSGNLVFCGAEIPPQVVRLAAEVGLTKRIFAVTAPDNLQLEAIYNRAYALLFPSRCEGFGWPVIEAQACGCPVVCSDRTSLPEVGGNAALVFALEDEAGMANALLDLRDEPRRTAIKVRGWANLARFDTERMIDAYVRLYEDVLARPRP